MARTARQHDELTPLAAMAGAYTAMLDAARYSGAGMRTAGRRTGRRARWLAATSGARGAEAVRVLLGRPSLPPPRARSRTRTVTWTALAGTGGALAVVVIGRLLGLWPENGVQLRLPRRSWGGFATQPMAARSTATSPPASAGAPTGTR